MRQEEYLLAFRENAGKALELDSTNVRGWYVLGSNDYYTPASFGGGKKVEYYLKKATSSPDKNTDDSSLPTWGKKSPMPLLIQYYYARTIGRMRPKLLADGREGVSGQLFIGKI